MSKIFYFFLDRNITRVIFMVMSERITMKQIADELGLSRRVVSSVVNNKARERGVRAETEERVRAYLKQRGYVPSSHARGLRMGIRNTVGILYAGKLYSHLTEGFNRIISNFHQEDSGISVVLASPSDIESGLQDLIGRGVRNLIWLHAGHLSHEMSSFEDLIPYLKQFDKRIIYNHRFDDAEWDAVFSKHGIFMVGVDRYDGFYRLGSWLRSLGHSCVSVPHPEISLLSMRAGAGLTKAGIDCIPFNGFANTCDPDQIDACADFIQRSMKETGITAACFLDDEIAGAVMTVLCERGVKIPEHLTVTGFDGIPVGASFAVPLTTLGVPVKAMVKRVDRIIKGDLKRYRQKCRLEIIQRKSHSNL